MTAISNELVRLLNEQRRFDGLRDVALRHGGRQFVDLAYANSYDGPTPETLQALRNALQEPSELAFQYTPYGGATVPRRLAAQALRDSHGLPFAWRDVVLTPGAMAALNIAFRSVRLQPDDEVIVITPCWLDYPLYLENIGLRTKLVPVDERSLRLDLDAIAAALTPKTRALILSQPANPAGLIYSADELGRLGRLLAASDAAPLLISDECHRDVVFEPHRFVSPVEHYDKTCVVYSFGKSLLLQGQRLGYLAVSPRHPERADTALAWEQLTRIMGYCTPTALMQLALGDLLDVRGPVEAVAKRRELALRGLRAAGYEFQPSEATFFIYPRAPGGDADAFAERLAHKGVAVLPAGVFHHRGYFRISLTATDEMVERGLSILAELKREIDEETA